MKTTLCFTLILFTLVTLAIVPNSFAQDALSEPSVRVVYFLPNDRPARPDRIEALRQLIKEGQAFFADEMQRHGFGRKTFTIETDEDGEPFVHHIGGKFTEYYYSEGLIDFKIWEEVFAHFDEFQHVYFIAIDMSSELISGGLGGPMFFPSNIDQPVFSFGSVSVRHRDITEGEELLGGSAIIPAYDSWLGLTAHELGHAFGLEHDFREDNYNTSYVMNSVSGLVARDKEKGIYNTSDVINYGNKDQLSICSAEWLSVNPFFNSNPIIHNARAEIRLISHPVYNSDGIKLRFEVTDADGLHQAQLLVPAIYKGTSWGPYRLFDCKQINGETSTTIEFISEALIAELVDRITLQIIDVNGSITWATFPVDIASIVPPPKVVSIPDTQLAKAVRKALGLGANARITDQALKRLTTLDAGESQIKNLTGLEHATQLTRLILYKNQIRDVSPLAGLTQLKILGLDGNQISNILPLTGLTQLEGLYIGENQINNGDVRLLTKLKQLKWLVLHGNQISNITPLAKLTKLEGLWIGSNKIRDVSPLAGLVNLRTLQLRGNPVQDFSPLANLKKLSDVDIEIRQQSVPTTGTWLAVVRPQSLTPGEFIIKPGEFVVLAHRGKRAGTGGIDFNDYYHQNPQNAQTPDIPNLARFFENGGRIELFANIWKNPSPPDSKEPQFGDVVISEIMWGLDGSAPRKQYIELYNASTHPYTFIEGNLALRFSTTSEAPLPNETFPFPFNPNAPLSIVIDRVSNKGWNVPGKSGNTSKNNPLISMYRTIDYTTTDIPDGTLARSWEASKGRVNLPPPSYGTPGAKHLPPAPVVHIESSQRPPLYWVNAEAGTLHRLVGADVEHLLPRVKNATSLAVDRAGGKLYWTEKTGKNKRRIRVANLDGIPTVKLIKNLTSHPLDITLDTRGEKLYVINAWGKLQRLNTDGSHFQPNLITGLQSPRHLTLDATGGKVYWTEQTGNQSGKIQRANFDGTHVELVKELTSVPRGLGLDTAKNKLYLANAYGKIQRLNLDGSNYQPNLIRNLDAPESCAVDSAAGKVYWIQQGSLRRANRNAKNIQTVVSGLGDPTDLTLVGVARGAAAPLNTSRVSAEILPPAATALLTNYPNPFNPETWIPYQLSEPADVTLHIYAVDGILVRTLALGHQQAGIYQSRSRAAYWDGRNALGEPVASGVYFYTLTAGDFSATRKMLIRK